MFKEVGSGSGVRGQKAFSWWFIGWPPQKRKAPWKTSLHKVEQAGQTMCMWSRIMSVRCDPEVTVAWNALFDDLSALFYRLNRRFLWIRNCFYSRKFARENPLLDDLVAVLWDIIFCGISEIWNCLRCSQVCHILKCLQPPFHRAPWIASIKLSSIRPRGTSWGVMIHDATVLQRRQYAPLPNRKIGSSWAHLCVTSQFHMKLLQHNSSYKFDVLIGTLNHL